MSARGSSKRKKEEERIEKFTKEWVTLKKLSGEYKQYSSADEATEACKRDYLAQHTLTEKQLQQILGLTGEEPGLQPEPDPAIYRAEPNPYSLMVQCAKCGEMLMRHELCKCSTLGRILSSQASRHMPTPMPPNPWELEEAFNSGNGIHPSASQMPACEACKGHGTILVYGEGGIVEGPCEKCGGCE